MTTIYELQEKHQKLYDELFFLADSDDLDDLERIEYITKKIDEITGNAEYKIKFKLKLLAEINAVAEQRRESARRMQKRAQRSEGLEKQMRESIMRNMLDFKLTKVEGDFLTASIYKKTDIEFVGNVYDLPDDLVRRREPEPMLANIKRAFKEGREGLKGVIELTKDVMRVS